MTIGFTRQWLALLLAIAAVTAPGLALAASGFLDLDVELDPGTRQLKATAFLVPEERDFRFELHESLRVTAATADGKAVRVFSGERLGPVRTWQLQVPAKSAGVRIEYEGTLPPLDRSLDDRGVLRQLPPMASNEGSFLPAGGAWYPRPGPLFAYRVSLSVPADQRGLVPGRLLSETVPTGTAGRYRATFAFSRPAEGIDLMAGPWIVREKTLPRADGSPVRLRTYFFRDLDAVPGLADGYLEDAGRYLERYSEQIGAYPFTEFSVVASPLPTGFAMPTLTYLGAEVLKLPFIRATSLGHEILHNWWGNGVYVDYASGNWSEGLTTFMADYAAKERESAEAARRMRQGWLRDFASVPAGEQQSLASFTSRTHGAEAAVGYGKAAMVFLMLRDAIGETAFHRGIRKFWRTQRFRIADWSDLRAVFEQASGRSLVSFFDQWLDRSEGPAVKVASAVVKPDKGKLRLTVAVEQSAPPYALHLPLEIVFAHRTATRWVDVERQREAVKIAVDTVPEGVRLDPDMRVWRVLDPDQLPPILRQWIIARAPRLIQASAAREVRDAAESLANRFFETAPQAIAPDQLNQSTEPVLLVGLHEDVDALLARAGLPPRPANLAGRGSAQVWTVLGATGAPVAVISANDADAIRALQRPLPHYGAQSWLAFEGSRMLERGVWPAPARLIPVTGLH
jgi:hypothetical protein